MEATTQHPDDTNRSYSEPDHGVRPDAPDRFYDDEDGVYQGIPEDEYHALQRASQSTLQALLDNSPAHAKAKMEEDLEPTPAQKVGTAIHAALLQPDLFDATYDVKGQCEGETNSGSRCSRSGKHPVTDAKTGEIQWYCGTHRPDEGEDAGTEEADIEVLSESRMETVEAIRAQARSHPAASALLYEHPGLSELTVLWAHPTTEVRCKSRVDHLIKHPRMGYVAIDVKTTRDAAPTERGFPRSAAQYGYHRQAAFYRTALEESGIPVDEYMILAVEKEPPYAVVPYIVYDDNKATVEGQTPIAEGIAELEAALRTFKQCRMDERWPTYTEAVERLRFPDWAFK